MGRWVPTSSHGGVWHTVWFISLFTKHDDVDSEKNNSIFVWDYKYTTLKSTGKAMVGWWYWEHWRHVASSWQGQWLICCGWHLVAVRRLFTLVVLLLSGKPKGPLLYWVNVACSSPTGNFLCVSSSRSIVVCWFLVCLSVCLSETYKTRRGRPRW